jgi:hypothetical protein
MSKRVVLSNILSTLADTQSLENREGAVSSLVRNLGYAGVRVTADEILDALTEQAVAFPSCFGVQPVLSRHYCPWGQEFRIRQPDAVRASRAGIEAVYEQTDRLPRVNDDGGIELVRPNAFARSLGHLRVRWAKGNFSVPRAATIRGWWTAEQRAHL